MHGSGFWPLLIVWRMSSYFYQILWQRWYIVFCCCFYHVYSLCIYCFYHTHTQYYCYSCLYHVSTRTNLMWRQIFNMYNFLTLTQQMFTRVVNNNASSLYMDKKVVCRLYDCTLLSGFAERGIFDCFRGKLLKHNNNWFKLI